MSICSGLFLCSLTLVAFLTLNAFCFIASFHVSTTIVVKVIVIVPSLRTAWIILGQYKHEIVSSELNALLRVRDNVLDLFKLLLVMHTSTAIALTDSKLGLLFILELIVVHHLSPVQSNWNHISTSCQVVEQV